jgi:expansin (peptidoglycan-binding protein)
MRKLVLAFCFSALLGAGFVACGDDSSASAADTLSSESSLESSSSEIIKVPASTEQGRSEPAEGSSSSEIIKVPEPAEGSSSSEITKVPEPAEGTSSSVNVALSSSSAAPESSSDDDDGDDGKCTACDSYTAADPELIENGGKGSVTTYGSITAKETSLGGACNYGQTNIQYYAAIHVNVSPGDEKGPWNGGAACGGCVRVKAKTPDGWKKVTVRITDRCPDADCGVDLGGAPASDIMGIQVGRYYGEWEFVSCEGVDGVWGDSTSIWVKEGASEFWSIIQVRNPKDMVKSIAIYGIDTSDFYELEMVVGTENFWTVPEAVLKTDNRYRVVVKYRTGTDDEWKIKGSDLAVPEANLYLYEHRE